MIKIYKNPLLIIVFLFTPFFIFASTTDGTIDAVYKYAWGENTGWINFGVAGGNVHVLDSALTGNAWSDNYGWIKLNPSTSGVLNNSEGTLSGYAWGENLGWINFTGVTINTSGEFLGYATIDRDASRISFNCSNGNSCGASDFKVKTDWRPASSRASGGTGGTSGAIPYGGDILNRLKETISSAASAVVEGVSSAITAITAGVGGFTGGSSGQTQVQQPQQQTIEESIKQGPTGQGSIEQKPEESEKQEQTSVFLNVLNLFQPSILEFKIIIGLVVLGIAILLLKFFVVK